MLTECPACKISWQSENRILDDLCCHPAYRHYTEEQLIEAAASYGDTEETPRHFSKNVLLCEDPNIYDGALYYKCLECDTDVGRFSHKIINEEYTHEDENKFRREEWRK